MSTHTKHMRLALGAALSLVACEGASSTASTVTDAGTQETDVDAGTSTATPTDDADAGSTSREDAGSEGDASDCYADPKTYLEIINACTDAEKIDKRPTLPLLRADGSLPDLP